MATINELSTLSTVTSSDLFPVYSSANGDARKVSASALLTYFQSSFASPTVSTTLYVPATGFNIAIGTPTSNLWVLLQPAGVLATGTITLPLNTSTPDGTEILVTTTQAITAFTLALNGASNGFGAPTTLAANAYFRMRFYQATNSWYRIS